MGSKKARDQAGRNTMRPKLCLAIAFISVIIIQTCHAIPEESDIDDANELGINKRSLDNRIRLAKKDNRIRLARKWDSRIRLAKKWDSRIRLAKKYMDWDKRIRLAKRSWDSRIRLAKRDGLGL